MIAGREMLDCFEGKPVTYWPRRAVEVRAGGRWHEVELRCHYWGPDGRAVAWVEPRFYEPEWRAVVTVSRFVPSQMIWSAGRAVTCGDQIS
ncbi:hypothetical protein AB0D27_33960 [Streptomyces sp. NPDC048415]|uniref:hypothetical protein n=1 Tax=Streptomyces sp. NPDC048415 TaxID=3154822 RepID=UPI00343CB73A